MKINQNLSKIHITNDENILLPFFIKAVERITSTINLHYKSLLYNKKHFHTKPDFFNRSFPYWTLFPWKFRVLSDSIKPLICYIRKLNELYLQNQVRFDNSNKHRRLKIRTPHKTATTHSKFNNSPQKYTSSLNFSRYQKSFTTSRDGCTV